MTDAAVINGDLSATTVTATGESGSTAVSRYAGATSSGAPTSGTYSIGDFIIDQSGSIWICTSAGTPGTWKQLAAAGVGLLGATSYAPGTAVTYTLAHNELANLDTTNLAVTFTTTGSGIGSTKVLVKLSAFVYIHASTGGAVWFAVYDSNSTKRGPTAQVADTIVGWGSGVLMNLSASLLVTGLSANTSYTFYFAAGYAETSGTAPTIIAGDAGGSTSTEPVGDVAPAVIEVWAA